MEPIRFGFSSPIVCGFPPKRTLDRVRARSQPPVLHVIDKDAAVGPLSRTIKPFRHARNCSRYRVWGAYRENGIQPVDRNQPHDAVNGTVGPAEDLVEFLGQFRRIGIGGVRSRRTCPRASRNANNATSSRMVCRSSRYPSTMSRIVGVVDVNHALRRCQWLEQFAISAATDIATGIASVP